MTIIDTIPAERLALLDTATLYHGPHQSGGPDCRHCARELLHEVVTGTHADKTPPGVTAFVDILPGFNDAPGWRDDAHRTAVMRPYLKRFLALDPAPHDRKRVYALVDHAYRQVLPALCDTLNLPDEAAKLRALDLDPALDLDLDPALDRALDLARARALALAFARDPQDWAGAWEQAVREVLDMICSVV